VAFRLSSWGIRNPVPVTILFVALSLLGIASFVLLPVKGQPSVVLPIVVVTVTENGAAPAQMEAQITRPVEDAVAGVAGIKHISSTVVQGASTTTIEFVLGTDLQKVTDQVRSNVDQARVNLPRDIDPPVVTRVDMDDNPLLTYAVSAPTLSDTDLSWFIDNTVAREIQAVKGVGHVYRAGGIDQQVNITLDPDRMAALGATAPQVNEALRAFTNDVPGGRAAVGGRETTIRVEGMSQSVDTLRNLSIPLGGGRYARLSDVADVGMGAAEERGFARLNNRPTVAIRVTSTKGFSEVEMDQKVRAKIAEIGKQHPEVRFSKILSQVDDTKRSFDSTIHVLIEGMLLAALVVFLFLRDWRSTLISAVAMPLSLLPTFIGMLLFGFTLNQVTMLSLTLVIGILVDDAIVEIENIQKRIERGQRPYQAAMEGADAIGLAVIACTMTIVVVFTPVSFMNTFVGQFFKEFGVTVALSVMFSLLVARLLTPLLAAYFLSPSHKPEPERRMPPFYRSLLGWALAHKWLSAGFGALFFIGSLGLAAMTSKAFMPTEDPGYLFLTVDGPPGSTAQSMSNAVTQTTRLLLSKPDVESVFANIGGNTQYGGQLSSGDITVKLKDRRSMSTDAFKRSIRDQLRGIADARITTSGGWGGADVTMILASQDGAALLRVQTDLLHQMRGLKEVREPRPDPPPAATELVIRAKTDEAARLNVTTEAIASVARVATIGDIDANVAKFNMGDRLIPIRVRLPLTSSSDLTTIGNLRVPTADGSTTPLSSVATIGFEPGPAQVVRFDRERRASVNADLNGVPLGAALEAINKLPVMKHLPAGVHQAQQGDQEAFIELFTGMVAAMFAGVAMIYAVLVLLFRSFFKPAIILSTLPFCLGGAFFALLITNLSLSLPSMIGILMLLGIAGKNSILLVEFAIEDERAGQSRTEALMNACRERSRPIIMTTVAMAAGMLPTALGVGEGAAFRQPMAVAVIGGLISSTALSLVLVPVVYEIFDNIEKWLGPAFGRLITPREAAERKEERDELFGYPRPAVEPGE
jgi:HAE1 family hydrophobic/amphiphilic exporter-1